MIESCKRWLYVMLVTALIVGQSQAIQDEDPCKDVPQKWGPQEIGDGKLGKINGTRDGDNLTVKDEKLADGVKTTRDAHKACKKICVEVFNGDTPPEGVKTTAPIKIGDQEFPQGSTFWGHFKVFILTPCKEMKPPAQIRDTTTTVDGVKDENASTNGFVVDPGIPTGKAPGDGGVASDSPGTLVSKDKPLPEKETVTVKKTQFYTFFNCGEGPVAVVCWDVTMTLTEGPQGRTCKSEHSTPTIFCHGEKGYNDAREKLMDAVNRAKEEEKKKKKDK